MRNLTSKSRMQLWACLCVAAGIYACGSSADDGKGSQTNGGAGYNQNPNAGGTGNSQQNNGGVYTMAGGSGVWTYTGTPPFKGDQNFRPLSVGCGPETANSCVPCNHPNGSGSTAAVVRPPSFLCFGADSSKGAVDPTDTDPAAIIEQVIETQNGKTYAHIRVTFDPTFADNTYGVNAVGWSSKGHTFADDLTKSDHIELMLTDGTGSTVMYLGEDYVSSPNDTGGPPKKDDKGPGGGPGPGPAAGTGGAATVSTTSTAPVTGCGYKTLGVLGGDGFMKTGSSDYVIGVATSIARNLECGYCQSAACSSDGSVGDCTVNSPKTDDQFTANPLTPNWNYNVVYEVWIDTAAFGSAGFGQAYVEFVHASPSKSGTNTMYVSPISCPPQLGHCTAGQDCWVSGDAGTPPSGGDCPQNEQIYVAADGSKSCTPIPFANYGNHEACPTGYVLDTASEGRYCLPK